MPVKFPCKICKKPVAKNHKAICCDVCDLLKEKVLLKEKLSWSCIVCSKDVFPFSKLNETSF